MEMSKSKANSNNRKTKDPGPQSIRDKTEFKPAMDKKLLVEENPLIEQLIELGEEQGYILIDDILEICPQAEENIDLLEELYEAILLAGIPFSDNGGISDFISKEPPAGEGQPPSTAEETHVLGKSRDVEAIDAGDTIGAYLSQAGLVPLLTHEQEIDLSKRIERGRKASEDLARKTNSIKRRLTLKGLVRDGLSAREHLILANLRLVFSMAKKYAGRGLPLMDLVQEGHVGLMRAVKKFDYRRGYKFSTYATWWIRQAVSRAVADQGRTIRLPVHMGDRISKMLRTRHQLTQKLGREPTPEELSETMKEQPSKVLDMIRFAQRAISLDLPIDNDEDSVIGDFIENEEAPDPVETTEMDMLREHLWEILDKLPAREVRVLQLRYGLKGGHTHTLSAIGQKMGISRERVRQIEAQAKNRLLTLGLQYNFVDYLRK
jgi:RNA polymerase primary sigma factor